MADPVNGPWPVEDIPDADRLFMRVHRNLLKFGEPVRSAFKDHHGSMSTNWSKYSDAEDTRQRSAQPWMNAVISLPVDQVRAIPQLVQHSPDPASDPEKPWIHPNRAHTGVIGEKDAEVRVKFSRIYRIEIPLAT